MLNKASCIAKTAIKSRYIMIKTRLFSSETVAGMLFAAYDDALLDVINRFLFQNFSLLFLPNGFSKFSKLYLHVIQNVEEPSSYRSITKMYW